MATAAEIIKVRLYIDDAGSDDFTDAQIALFIDEGSSVYYAVIELSKILKMRLRKELLEADTTGTESTKLASLRSRADLLDSLIKDFEKKLEEENGTETGRYIASVKPTIAGGDV